MDLDPTRFHTDIMRANILNNIKTNNIILDIILGVLLMGLLNKILEQVTSWNIADKFYSLFHFKSNNKKNRIILVRKEFISTNHWDTKIIYPKSILSIYNHINKHNLVDSGTLKYVEFKKDKNFNSIYYFIESKVPIKLNDDIYFERMLSEDGKMITANNKGEKAIEHKYCLFSYKKSIKDLIEFLNILLENLDKDVIYELNKKPYYFIFDKKDDGLLVFDEYNLEHDRSFENVFFDQKDNLKKRLDFFLNNREWYQKKGIPYTLGLMFSGKPGCGKTSTIKAIAKYTNRHIIDIPLSKIESCKDLMNMFYGEEINGKKIPMNKRIYLFEDIDSILDILKEREEADKKEISQNSNIIEETIKQNTQIIANLVKNKKEHVTTNPFQKLDKLNLGFFLNLIDGVLETPGRILIISTNYPDKLDKALVRPGRIDMKVHLEKCSKQVICDILKHYYIDYEKIEDSLLNILYEKNITPAELYQICFKFPLFSEFEKLSNPILFTATFDSIMDPEEEQNLKYQSNIVKIQKNTEKTPLNKYMILKNRSKNIHSFDSDSSGEKRDDNENSDEDE